MGVRVVHLIGSILLLSVLPSFSYGLFTQSTCSGSGCVQQQDTGAWCYVPKSGETALLDCIESQSDVQSVMNVHLTQDLSIAYYHGMDYSRFGGASWPVFATTSVVHLCISGYAEDGTLQTLCVNVNEDDTISGSPYCEIADAPHVVSDGCYEPTFTPVIQSTTAISRETSPSPSPTEACSDPNSSGNPFDSMKNTGVPIIAVIQTAAPLPPSTNSTTSSTTSPSSSSTSSSSSSSSSTSSETSSSPPSPVVASSNPIFPGNYKMIYIGVPIISAVIGLVGVCFGPRMWRNRSRNRAAAAHDARRQHAYPYQQHAYPYQQQHAYQQQIQRASMQLAAFWPPLPSPGYHLSSPLPLPSPGYHLSSPLPLPPPGYYFSPYLPQPAPVVYVSGGYYRRRPVSPWLTSPIPLQIQNV
ncbi:uncharacterized protein LACBIDRAFT_301455 [Laccaria bicolor S238N-H82]|uniref:Predicted protein n=1 Tax=Laccaria bicolor (strain S238N-H82 / ATCC MYA-4686) TaxID=486041 RepID=B0CNL1_LACBS|nr:uncharacterized protein LACBIDRAFT_301455 [Laccaria bicolor S238N-H82]EDR15945.1 predicted protein [Laccaria bicolor S238N-H82]|eukprot:XP_001874153.1 predicted protein [Laccaria bicolor S238N-H82]